MHFTEYDTRTAAYAILLDGAPGPDRRILLTWYNGEGRHQPGWSLPGGGVEFEEDLEAGVVREVMEETGYVVQVGRPLVTQAWGRVEEPRPFRAVKVVFEATVVGGELGTVEVGGSTDFAEWVPLADLDGRGHRADIVDRGIAASRRWGLLD